MKQKEDLVAEVHRRGVGQSIKLQLLRGREKLDVTVTTIGKPQNPREPVIGVVIDTLPQIELPLAIEIDSRGIGGPSAGLMFAVGIVDLLDPQDLTKGRVIAGTGEIQLGGKVTAVGGVQQKVEAAKRVKADLFLVPEDELEQACSIAGELAVVAVGDLRQAIDVLDGERPPADRRCA
jgi:PDZ domain-containing protein